MIRRDPRRPRTGFTLIELLVVIVIIGILLALLLPAIVGAVRKANEARVSAEINTIAMGLEKFKSTYGEYPPSRVILSEQGIYSLSGGQIPTGADFTTRLSQVPASAWYGAPPTPNPAADTDISFGELAQRSRRALQKFFPRAILRPEFRQNGSLKYWPDFNGNADPGSPPNTPPRNMTPDPGFIYLEGHECLVFFLGGIPSATANTNGTITYGPSGFGKEPLYPFKNANPVNLALQPVDTPEVFTVNRNPPSYEFKGERLVDTDGDGIPGYLDPNASGGTGTFYAYFVSYGSVGYDPNDVNFVEGDPSDPARNTFRIGMPAISAQPNTVSSLTPNPYTSSAPAPLSPNQPAAYVNATGFQIISSGGDQLFGPGGQWTTSGDRLPVPPAAPPGIRDPESDNLSNFTSGRLN